MFKVYGKPNCASCKAAVSALESRSLPYQYLTLGKDYSLQEFSQVAPEGFRSFPLVVDTANDIVVGSFQDLTHYLREE